MYFSLVFFFFKERESKKKEKEGNIFKSQEVELLINFPGLPTLTTVSTHHREKKGDLENYNPGTRINHVGMP